MENKILFNDSMQFKPGSKTAEYKCLSNHYVCNMLIDDRQYNHVEGFYYSSMHIKTNIKLAERIRNVVFPGLCKKIYNESPLIGEELTKWNETRRILVMKRALFTKFITSGDMAKVLISTGNATLVYDKSDDEYWGTGLNNQGQNVLGKLLEEVRDVLTDLANVEE